MSIEIVIADYRENINADESHTFLITSEEYNILNYRKAKLEDSGVNFTSELFFFNEKNVYKIEKETNEILGPFELCCIVDFIKSSTEEIKKILDVLDRSVELLEDSLLDRTIKRSFMNSWFGFKKEGSKLDRHIRRSITTLENLELLICKEPDLTLDYHGVFQSISKSGTTNQGLLSRLDNIFSYYREIKSDKLNKDIYMLTVISAIFLPLNLIVGFFGINTEGLFFTGQANGTNSVLFILFGTLVFTFLSGSVLRFIDKFVFIKALRKKSMFNSLEERVGTIIDE